MSTGRLTSERAMRSAWHQSRAKHQLCDRRECLAKCMRKVGKLCCLNGRNQRKPFADRPRGAYEYHSSTLDDL
jgi:hypothetical protein